MVSTTTTLRISLPVRVDTKPWRAKLEKWALALGRFIYHSMRGTRNAVVGLDCPL